MGPSKTATPVRRSVYERVKSRIPPHSAPNRVLQGQVESPEEMRDVLEGVESVTDSSRNEGDDKSSDGDGFDKEPLRSVDGTSFPSSSPNGDSKIGTSIEGSVVVVPNDESADTTSTSRLDPAVKNLSSSFEDNNVVAFEEATSLIMGTAALFQKSISSYCGSLLEEIQRQENAKKQAQSEVASLEAQLKIANDLLAATEIKMQDKDEQIAKCEARLADVEKDRDDIKNATEVFMRHFGKNGA